eukprot:6954381-Ditylum_brightwellii.AAC.1
MASSWAWMMTSKMASSWAQMMASSLVSKMSPCWVPMTARSGYADGIKLPSQQIQAWHQQWH